MLAKKNSPLLLQHCEENILGADALCLGIKTPKNSMMEVVKLAKCTEEVKLVTNLHM